MLRVQCTLHVEVHSGVHSLFSFHEQGLHFSYFHRLGFWRHLRAKDSHQFAILLDTSRQETCQGAIAWPWGGISLQRLGSNQTASCMWSEVPSSTKPKLEEIEGKTLRPITKPQILRLPLSISEFLQVYQVNPMPHFWHFF